MIAVRAVRPRAVDRGRALLARLLGAAGGVWGRPEAFADRLEERTAAGYRALGAMEEHLAGGREWFVGNAMTLADITLYAYTHVAHEGGFELGRFPAVQAWLSRVAATPGHVPIDA